VSCDFDCLFEQMMEGYDGTAQEEGASHLPSFANKANRDLDAYIKRVRQELEYTDVSLEDNEDRIKVMSEHLANVQAELKYTQSRFNAKTNEIQTEDHLKQLSKRQGVRIAPNSTPNGTLPGPQMQLGSPKILH